MHKIFVTMMLFGLAIGWPLQSSAQKTMYKCSGVYQDKPCDSDMQNQYSSTTGGFTNQKANPRADLRCAKAGAVVQKIREDLGAGKTVESISAELSKSNGDKVHGKKMLEAVQDVSQMKGTPLQVRYKYEGECTDRRSAFAQKNEIRSRLMSGDQYESSAAASAARAAANAAQEAALEAQEAQEARYSERRQRRERRYPQ